MTIHIEELTFECIIGILDFERLSPQTVIIDAKIDYDYTNEAFINYAEVIALLQDNMIKNKYELLETALNDLGKKILFKYPKIITLRLKIMKPNIIFNANVSLCKTFNKKH